MAKRSSTRKNTRRSGKKGIAGRIYAPVGHVLAASGNTVQEVASTAGNITKRGLNGVSRVGHIWTNHFNQAATNVFKSRRNMKTRRGRRRNY
jgi:hypothetical protein